MLPIQNLIASLKTNPQMLKPLEVEVYRLTEVEDNSELAVLKNGTSEEQLYFLLIFEQKIKHFKKIGRSDVIVYLIQLLDFYPKFYIKKFSRIYALLGLYEYPQNFNGFYNNIVQLINSNDPLGIMILSDFLFMVEYSTEIDGKRRGELTKANKVMSTHYLQKVYEQLKEPYNILNEILNVIEANENINYEFLLTIPYSEKLLEILNVLLHEKKYFMKFLNYIQNIPLVLSTVIELTRTNLINSESLFLALNYISKPTEDKDIIFYSILFLKKNKKYLKDLDRTLKYNMIVFLVDKYIKFNNIGTTENELLTFNTNFLDIIRYLLNNSTLEEINDIFRIKEMLQCNKVPKKIFMCILDEINQMIKGNKLYADTTDIENLRKYENISFPYNDTFLDSYFLTKNKFREALNYLFMLKIEDYEDRRLIIKIIENYDFNNEEYTKLLEFFKDEEIKARIYLRNNIKTTFNFTTDTELFYFYLKFKGDVDDDCLNEFYTYFMNNFNFSLMKIMGEIIKNKRFNREDILEKLIENLDISGISIFIKEILANYSYETKDLKFDFKMKMIEKISLIILKEWSNEEDISHILKFTDILIKEYDRNKRTYNGSQYLTNTTKDMCTLSVNILTNFLVIDELDVLHPIISFLNKNRISDRTVVEKLMVWYRSSYDSLHSMIINNIITSGLLDSKIREMNNDGVMSSKKTKIMVREYLKEFKGKPLCELFKEENKVKEQGIWNKDDKPNNEFDIELDQPF